MSITLRNLRYFVGVAEARSIVGATLILNISQSAVTDAIKALEGELGAILFERHARGMHLTHAGHQFLRHAQRILQDVREAKQALSIRPDTLSGELNIGVTPLVTGYILPALLDRHRRVFPKVSINVVEDQRSYIEHLLVNGELDVGLLMVSQMENRQALDASPIARSTWRVWLPVNHPLTRQNTISLASLANEAIITTRLEELEDATLPFWHASRIKPHTIVRTTSIEAVRSLVSHGVGITILPDVFYRPWSLDGERIEWRPTKENIPALEIGVAWRGGNVLSEPAQHFMMLAREYAQVH
ncbi:LysR family transcriptional regulator [Acetobacter sp.]|uniref:LysR family transcriptional regulator n=1 Tax=Acetobacter sp. TaxID=440 RepID=UPI0039EA690C